MTIQEYKTITESGTVLVDFYATWCSVCKMLKPKLEEFAKEHPDIKVHRVNVEKSPQIAAELNISHLPTLVLYKDGKEVTRGGFDVLKRF